MLSLSSFVRWLVCLFVRPYPFFSLVSLKSVVYLECHKASKGVKGIKWEWMYGPRVFQWCFKGVSRKFKGCFNEDPRVSPWSFKGVSKKLQGNFKGVSRMFQGGFKQVSSKFQGRFNNLSRVFQVRLMSVLRGDKSLSREFQGYLKENKEVSVFLVFQQSWQGV